MTVNDIGPTASSLAALVAVLVAMWRSDKRSDGIEARLDKMDTRFDRIDADLRRFFEFFGRHDKAIELLEKK